MNERKQVREVSWERLFACELAPPKIEAGVTVKKCGCGNGSCKTAKGFVCRCSCKHLNHGQEQRRGMQPLEKALELEKPAAFQLVPWLEVC